MERMAHTNKPCHSLLAVRRTPSSPMITRMTTPSLMEKAVNFQRTVLNMLFRRSLDLGPARRTSRRVVGRVRRERQRVTRVLQLLFLKGRVPEDSWKFLEVRRARRVKVVGLRVFGTR
jgi:hypothetical protein